MNATGRRLFAAIILVVGVNELLRSMSYSVGAILREASYIATVALILYILYRAATGGRR